MWILNDPTRYQDFVRPPRGADDADEQISWICVSSGFGFRRTGCVYQRSDISTTLMKFSSLKAWSRRHRRIVIRQGGIAGPPRRRGATAQDLSPGFRVRVQTDGLRISPFRHQHHLDEVFIIEVFKGSGSGRGNSDGF